MNAVVSLMKYKSLLVTPIRKMAGHNKWSNIKHIKAAKDSKKAAISMKIMQKMRLAIKEGGSHKPELNSRLARLVDEARSNNIPMSSVENVLKSAEKNKNQGTHLFVEGKGPGGCMMIVEVFSDNPRRTRQELSAAFRKSGGAIGDSGTASHAYNYKGIVNILKEGCSLNADEATELAIECEAEDVSETVDDNGREVWQFITERKDVHKVKSELEKRSYKSTEARFAYIPELFVELDEPVLAAAISLCNYADQMSDVIRVYDNIKIQ
ncbi:DgyrCDS175 [Dimorphilus gyrociliatus]|uniref:Translational activator of cytochrome c oxidase 1 n=1 Tax=Dimorphilus gyrociliatus TaxID=2664684 RepID=A0A7I8V3T2_9ANNE|nr:DgyrCDS175 [Dimorphilus gyrociliatus]